MLNIWRLIYKNILKIHIESKYTKKKKNKNKKKTLEKLIHYNLFQLSVCADYNKNRSFEHYV